MMSSSLNGTAQGHPHLSSPPPSTTVTNYTFEYLVELNNLTDESCLVVISEKVYDLTLWLQDQLSPPSLPSQSFPLSPSASPPPSPSSISSERLASLGASPTGKNTWHQVGSTTDWDRTSPPPPEASDPFVPLDPIDGLHRVLYLSKSDPIRAGETIREIFESEQRNRIESFRNQPSLDEWIQDFRIGDYARPSAPNPSCNQHQSMRTSLVPALDSSRRFSKKRQNPRESQHNCCGPELHVAHQQPDLGSCQGTSKQPAQSSSVGIFLISLTH
ncbi:hypothetical protein BY996DRAFT_799982 [Phakopsora pachyrhizi]|nr:hypothetical protein BY996DRAFT_799982 [Phakopsora pachyrhizi]